MSPRRILVVGFGAIASELIAALLGLSEDYRIALLLRRGAVSNATVPAEVAICESHEDVTAFEPDLVVEAAGHSAVYETVPDLLGLGLPVLVASVGALHDDALLARLVEVARQHGGQLILPSGALGALDYVRAVRDAECLTITYESRKPPAAWAPELRAMALDAATLDRSVTLFDGTARDAAAAYPQNLNVAAALGLAGPGLEHVRVKVICDPEIDRNAHAVSVKSAFGTMRIEIANQPSPANPKTSWIVSRSLLAAIRQHFSPIRML